MNRTSLRRAATPLAACLIAVMLTACGKSLGLPPQSEPGPSRVAFAGEAEADPYGVLFRDLDRDDDGVLAAGEFDAPPAIAARLDVDRDGAVTPAEWGRPVTASERVPEAPELAEVERRLGSGDVMGPERAEDPFRAPGAGVVGPAAHALLSAYLSVTSRLATRRVLHPRRTKVPFTPAAYGMAYQDVALTTRDGLAIKGWYVPATTPTDKAVVLVHGHAGHRGGWWTDGQAQMLHAGYNVLAIDLRNHGESEGTVTSFGWHEAEDVRAAAAWLRANGQARVGVMGVSLGGAVVIRAAARHPELIDAVVADAAYATVSSAVQGFIAATGVPSPVLIAAATLVRADRELGVAMADADPVAHVAGIPPRPFFLVHGGGDPVIVPDNARINYLAAHDPAVGVWIAPGAGHGQSAVAWPAEYRRRLLGFLAGAL